jgi:hypothetical protein
MGHYSPDIFLAADQRYVCGRTVPQILDLTCVLTAASLGIFLRVLSTLPTIDSLGATKAVDVGVASLKWLSACVGAVRTIDTTPALLRNGFL